MKTIRVSSPLARWWRRCAAPVVVMSAILLAMHLGGGCGGGDPIGIPLPGTGGFSGAGLGGQPMGIGGHYYGAGGAIFGTGGTIYGIGGAIYGIGGANFGTGGANFGTGGSSSGDCPASGFFGCSQGSIIGGLGICDDVAVAAICVSNVWACPSGTIPISSCTCAGEPAPCGCDSGILCTAMCTASGWQCPTVASGTGGATGAFDGGIPDAPNYIDAAGPVDAGPDSIGAGATFSCGDNELCMGGESYCFTNTADLDGGLDALSGPYCRAYPQACANQSDCNCFCQSECPGLDCSCSGSPPTQLECSGAP